MEHLDAVIFFIGCMISSDISRAINAYIKNINGHPYVKEDVSSSVAWFIFIVTVLLIIF